MKNLYSRWTLLFIILIDGIGISIVYPTFAYYFLADTSTLFSAQTSYEGRLFYLGLAFAIYPFFMAIGSLLIGKASDNWGRKRSLLLCLSGFTFGFFVTAAGVHFNFYGLLILGRAIAGLTAGAHVIALASMADLSTGKDKTKNMGAVIMASTLGFVIGPALGGILSSADILPFFSARTPFAAVGLMGLIAIALTQLYFQETFTRKPLASPDAVNASDMNLFSNHHLLRLASVYFLFTLGWNFFFSIYSDLFRVIFSSQRRNDGGLYVFCRPHIYGCHCRDSETYFILCEPSE